MSQQGLCKATTLNKSEYGISSVAKIFPPLLGCYFETAVDIVTKTTKEKVLFGEINDFVTDSIEYCREAN